MIAGFDPSLTHYGWVILDEAQQGKDSLLSYGMFKTEPSDGLIIQRLITQRERVKKFLSDNHITFVAMEAPIWESYSTELLWALNQFTHEVFLDLGTYILYLQPTCLKKFAYPDKDPNEITKHHMTHAAKSELDKHGTRFAEHIADAYFAGKIGWYFYRWHFLKLYKDEELPEYLQWVFCGKKTYTRGAKKGITEYHGAIYRENDQIYDYSKQKQKTTDIIKGMQNG